VEKLSGFEIAGLIDNNKPKGRFVRGVKVVGANGSWWMTCITFENGIDIATLKEELKEKGIPARRLFMPLTKCLPYKIYKCADYKNASHIYEYGLCLPSSTLNSEEDIDYVCNLMKKFIKE